MKCIAYLNLVICGGMLLAGADERSSLESARKELEPRTIAVVAPIKVIEFLALLEKQTGNRVVDQRQMKSQAPVNLELDKISFWPALDRFCAMAGCGSTAYGVDGVVALVDRPRRTAPVSYQGITRTAFKHLVIDHDFEGASITCTIHLDLAWEPRFQPFYVGVGPATVSYVTRGVAKELKVQTPARGQIPVSGRSATEVEILLPAPPRQSPAIASLEGSFKFLGPSKMLTFRFTSVKAAAALTQEEVSVRLNSVKEGLDRVLIEVQIDNPEGTPVFESFQTWLDNNRIALVKDSGGKQQTWRPEPNETVLLETNRRAIIQYAFPAPANKGKLADWALEYRTPGRIVELTVPYSFKDVPLP